MLTVSVPVRRPAASPTTEIEAKVGMEVREIGIPPRPQILDRINREMARDDPDFKRLADIVGSDVALAASVIKVANSPYFGFSKLVRSVSEALLVLGLKTIVTTIAGLELKKTFPHVPSLERFWDSSARIARVCGWLAQALRVKGLRSEDAYTFGLFRDCGIPVLMIPFPEYPEVLKAANAEALRAFTMVEDERMGINHAGIGAELAGNWLLPEEIHLAIRHHHDPAALDPAAMPSLPPSTSGMIAVAHLAEHLIQHATRLSQTREWPKLGAAAMARLGIADADLEPLHAGCGPAIAADA